MLTIYYLKMKMLMLINIKNKKGATPKNSMIIEFWEKPYSFKFFYKKIAFFLLINKLLKEKYRFVERKT